MQKIDVGNRCRKWLFFVRGEVQEIDAENRCRKWSFFVRGEVQEIDAGNGRFLLGERCRKYMEKTAIFFHNPPLSTISMHFVSPFFDYVSRKVGERCGFLWMNPL